MPATFFTVTKDPLKPLSLLRNVIGGTVIWSVLIPLMILHAWTWVYQKVYFRGFGIPECRLNDHLTFDRNELKGLRIGQQFACAYCAYANGTISWIKAVINRTEVYSCAIKHRTVKLGQEHQTEFLPYEDFV